jgi:hypothetical protein
LVRHKWLEARIRVKAHNAAENINN